MRHYVAPDTRLLKEHGFVQERLSAQVYASWHSRNNFVQIRVNELTHLALVTFSMPRQKDVNDMDEFENIRMIVSADALQAKRKIEELVFLEVFEERK